MENVSVCRGRQLYENGSLLELSKPYSNATLKYRVPHLKRKTSKLLVKYLIQVPPNSQRLHDARMLLLFTTCTSIYCTLLFYYNAKGFKLYSKQTLVASALLSWHDILFLVKFELRFEKVYHGLILSWYIN